MNILLVAGPGISLREPFNSGIESFIVSFARQLSYQGHTVDVIADEANSDTAFKLVNPFTNISPDQPVYIRRLLEKQQFKKISLETYDVIHYHMFYPHLLKAGLTFNKNIFLTLHSPIDFKRISLFRELLAKQDIKFVAISKRIKDQYGQALSINIPIISNGIDIDLWPMRKLKERPYLLWSARITEEKNVSAAIRLAQHMKLPLVIAGRIVSQDYFDSQVQPHLNGQIRYVGHVTQSDLSILAENTLAYLATATWQEPFGLAALEMLACGVPVVGFKTAVPITWRDTSVLTVDSTRWQELVDLVTKSKNVSSAACREFASSMTVEKMTSEYIKMYSDELLYKNEKKLLKGKIVNQCSN